MHPPSPTHSLTFSKTNLSHPHQIFTISFPWSVSFSTCPASKAGQFYFSHFHWNLQTDFCFESKQCPLDSIPTFFFFKLCFYELGPIITNLVNLSLSGGIFPSYSNKLLSSLFSKNHLYPLMISTTFVWFQTPTSFPKFSTNLLPPAFNLTCLLTQRFSTCGPRTTGGPRPSAWWSASKTWYLFLFKLNLAIEITNGQNLFVCIFFAHADGNIFQF